MENKNVYTNKEIVDKFGFRSIWAVRDFCKKYNIKREVIKGDACLEFARDNFELFNNRRPPCKLVLIDKKDFERVYHKKAPLLSNKVEKVKAGTPVHDEVVLNILKELLQKVEKLENTVKDIADDKKKEEFETVEENNAKKADKMIEALNRVENQKKQCMKNSYEEYVLEKDEINKLITSLNATGTRLRLYYSYLEYVTGVNLNKYKEELLKTYSLKNIGGAERKRMCYIKNIIIEDPMLRKPFLKLLREKEKEMIRASAS